MKGRETTSRPFILWFVGLLLYGSTTGVGVGRSRLPAVMRVAAVLESGLWIFLWVASEIEEHLASATRSGHNDGGVLGVAPVLNRAWLDRLVLESGVQTVGCGIPDGSRNPIPIRTTLATSGYLTKRKPLPIASVIFVYSVPLIYGVS